MAIPAKIRPTLAILRVEEFLGLIFIIPGVIAPFLLIQINSNHSLAEQVLQLHLFHAAITLVAVLGFIMAIQRYPESTRQLRDFAPFLLVIAIYLQHDDLILLFNPKDIHTALLRLDLSIFGFEPSVWAERFYHPRLTDWFALSYMHYYVVTLFLLIVLYVKGRQKPFRIIMSTMMVTYYIGFLGYLIFPAESPYLTIPERYSVDIWHNTGFLSDWVRSIVNLSPERSRDAFPSLHNAITLLTLVFAWRYSRLFFWIQLPFGLSLVMATLYLRYHYAVDIIAGFLVTVAALQLTPLLEAWWIQKQSRLSQKIETQPLRELNRE